MTSVVRAVTRGLVSITHNCSFPGYVGAALDGSEMGLVVRPRAMLCGNFKRGELSLLVCGERERRQKRDMQCERGSK